MIVMINGSFGVGKTTVANLLRNTLAGSAIYDPEWPGFVLMRLPKWIGLKGSGTDDFQDIDLWRVSTVAGIRMFRFFVSGPVIIPMTFSCRSYFEEVVTEIRRIDHDLRMFCLKASVPTVKKRLMERGVKFERPNEEWVARRIIECEEAHRDSHFGEPVDTEDRCAREVAEEIVRRLQRWNATTA